MGQGSPYRSPRVGPELARASGSRCLGLEQGPPPATVPWVGAGAGVGPRVPPGAHGRGLPSSPASSLQTSWASPSCLLPVVPRSS